MVMNEKLRTASTLATMLSLVYAVHQHVSNVVASRTLISHRRFVSDISIDLGALNLVYKKHVFYTRNANIIIFIYTYSFHISHSIAI